MPRRSGKIVSVVIGDNFASFCCFGAEVQAGVTAASWYSLYRDTPGQPISQVDILRRSSTLALLQRAFDADSWVTVDSEHPGSTLLGIADHNPERVAACTRVWLSKDELPASDESLADLDAGAAIHGEKLNLPGAFKLPGGGV